MVTHWQLVQLGLGREAIKYRLRSGRLHRVQFGVYSVGHAVLTWHGRCISAVLSYGPRAVLSHRAAIALHELRPSSSPVIDVTVPERGREARGGIRLHRVRSMHPDDVTVHEGIPVTSISRTLLDFAEVAAAWELERAIEEAERRGLFDLNAVNQLCDRSPGRRGVPRLRGLLVEQFEAPATRSDLERDFLDVCRQAGLPRPAINVDVAGFEVDCVWPDRRLVVELDSRTFHERRSAFEADRIRDAALQVAGYRVIRVTHRRLATEPAMVVETLARLSYTPASQSANAPRGRRIDGSQKKSAASVPIAAPASTSLG